MAEPQDWIIERISIMDHDRYAFKISPCGHKLYAFYKAEGCPDPHCVCTTDRPHEWDIRTSPPDWASGVKWYGHKPASQEFEEDEIEQALEFINT